MISNNYLRRFLATVLLALVFQLSNGQTINWRALQPAQKHIVNLNLGFDHATVFGVGYGYRLATKMPLVLGMETTLPFGENPFDEVKTKVGGQLNLLRANSFYTTVKAYGVIRRFENDFARMINFGSEFTATAGIYKRNWFTAVEFGFDKAVVTHIKHSGLMKEYNPEVQTGWYLPTGGHFIYGLQGGYSFERSEFYAKLGRTLMQDLHTTARLPYYFQVGWNRKW